MDLNNKDIWREIPGYDGRYYVSINGEVYTTFSNRLLIPDKNKKGYLVARLSYNGTSKNCRVHRLVAQMFIPNPEGKPDVNHKNMVKDDNRLENLEWCTVKENNDHAKSMFGSSWMGGSPPKTIEMICEKTNHVKVFKSINEATRYMYPEITIPKKIIKYSEKIRKVLRGERRTHKGFIFKYVD